VTPTAAIAADAAPRVAGFHHGPSSPGENADAIAAAPRNTE
jgi:hypothetical protein